MASEAPPPASPWRDRSLLLRALLYLVVAFALSNLLLWEPVDAGPVALLREGIADAAAAVLTLLGTASTASGDRVLMPHGAVRIVNACTGLDASVLLAAAVLAFPARWSARLIGVALAFGVLLPLNFVRVLTLAYSVDAHPEIFETTHLYVWPTVVIIACLGVLLLWIEHVALPRPGGSAP